MLVLCLLPVAAHQPNLAKKLHYLQRQLAASVIPGQ
jgi:hypothetical protein